MALLDRGVGGWRITVRHEGARADVLDALVRTGAAFLRTTPQALDEAIELGWLPGITTRVSVIVGSLEEALDAIAAGAVNLVVGDWDAESVGALREAVAPRPLIERTALPPETEIDDARAALTRPLLTAWLGQIDGSGASRPRYTWAPGRDEEPPSPRAACRPSGRTPPGARPPPTRACRGSTRTSPGSSPGPWRAPRPGWPRSSASSAPAAPRWRPSRGWRTRCASPARATS